MSLRINDTAPNFRAKTTTGEIDFHQWIGDGWAILFSHPKDFTPVCTTELGYMAKIEPEFTKRNTKLIGLSIDPVDDHAKWSKDIEETQGATVKYPLIGDTDLAIAGREGGRDLLGLLAHLLQRPRRIRPVEADPGRALLDVLGGGQGRQAPGPPVEHGAAPAGRLAPLDGLPLGERLAGGADRAVPEDVGVATDHLRHEVAQELGHRELAALVRDLGVEDDLEEEVAELAGELLEVAGVDRRRGLVRLFDEVGADVGEGLLAVPRAAAGGAQADHQVAQLADVGRCRGAHCRRLGVFLWLEC